MIDLNDEQEQKEFNYGPIPAGSRVLVQLEIVPTDYPDTEDPTLSVTKNGMLQLPCKFSVVAGSYIGTRWRENLTLPIKFQHGPLNDKQRLSAQIGGSTIRAIIEASRRIDPKSIEGGAIQNRRINTWSDLDGMTFPVRVGINNSPYEKDGCEYWNNRILAIITMANKEYQTLMNGGEFINKNGAVTGKGEKSKPSGGQSNSYDNQTVPVSNINQNNPLVGFDEVPF